MISLDDYNVNQLHYWTGFVTTTKDLELAEKRAKENNSKNINILF